MGKGSENWYKQETIPIHTETYGEIRIKTSHFIFQNPITNCKLTYNEEILLLKRKSFRFNRNGLEVASWSFFLSQPLPNTVLSYGPHICT